MAARRSFPIMPQGFFVRRGFQRWIGMAAVITCTVMMAERVCARTDEGTRPAVRVHLINGDRISGRVVEDNDQEIVLQTAFGSLHLSKHRIHEVEPLAAATTGEDVTSPAAQASPAPEKAAAEGAVWTRRMSVGYAHSGGNTQTAQGQWDVLINRKREKVDEWTLKLAAFYSSENGKMNGRKYYGQGRYAASFGRRKKWYRFIKLEADQDRFGGIDRRFIPSCGVGYWFVDEKDIKVMVETAAGYQHTRHRSGDREDQPVLLPRGYASRTFLGRITLSQDLVLYPSLADDQLRLRSETKVSVALQDNLNWTLNFLDEYNSAPQDDVKRNDYRLTSAVEFLF